MEKKRILLLYVGIWLMTGLFAQTDYMARGNASMEQGDYESAIRWYRQVEPINLSQSRRLYERLARSYKYIGNYTEAIRYNTLLLSMQRGSNRERVLLNLSGLWLLSGQYEEVIAHLEGLHFTEDDAESTRLVNLSSAYLRMNRPLDALHLLERALQAVSPGSSIYRTALQNRGYTEWVIGKYQDARKSLKQAILLYPDDRADKYVCLGNLAIVEAECGDYGQALKQIDAALRWQRANLGDEHPDYLVSIRKKAEILLKQSDYPSSVRLFKEYFRKEREYIIRNFAYMTESERQNFWAAHAPLLAECYVTEYVDPDFLFDVAVFSKSVLQQAATDFQHFLSQDKAHSADYARLKGLRFRLRTLLVGTERDALTRQADSLERTLIRQVSRLGAFAKSLSVSGNDVRQALKNTRDRLVEFIQYTSNDTVRYAALLAGKTQPVRFIPLFTRKEIENHSLGGSRKTVSQAIYSRSGSDKNRLYTDTLLGRAVWKNIMEHVPQDAAVYFVPDGLIHLLAIEYLCFDRPDCRFFRLSSSRQLCERSRGEQRPVSSMLLVGGLDYDDTSSVVQHADSLPDRRGSQTLLRDGMPPAAGGGFPYLPGSRAEVDSIGTTLLADGENIRLLAEAEGTEDAVKREMQRSDVVHISTHGFCTDYQVAPRLAYAKDSIPEDLSLLRCGLVLSGANRCARPLPGNEAYEDGILTARELCDLDLSHVRLAVLSACQTGLGRVTIDGVAGLPRGLKKSGAGAILMSLWEVDDRATQRLMTSFYSNLEEHGMTPHQALTAAQQTLRTEEVDAAVQTVFSPATLSARRVSLPSQASYDSPCYWAAFVLIDAL